MMNALITEGATPLGLSLARLLRGTGHQVCCLSRSEREVKLLLGDEKIQCLSASSNWADHLDGIDFVFQTDGAVPAMACFDESAAVAWFHNTCKQSFGTATLARRMATAMLAAAEARATGLIEVC